jgi:hypothetical protein
MPPLQLKYYDASLIHPFKIIQNLISLSHLVTLEEIMLFTTNPLATRCNWLSHAIQAIACATTFEF